MSDQTMVRMPLGKALDGLAARLTNRLIRATPRNTFDVPTTEPVVTFTFDDVPDSALFKGASILEKHELRGTFYIAGGLEGRVRGATDAHRCGRLP